MKKFVLAIIFATASSAFAHQGNMPDCRDLVKNTEGIVTLHPITSANNPIQAGANVVFAATIEGVDAGFCAAQVTVEGGKLVLIGLEDVMRAGTCVVEGAADLVACILNGIFGG